MASCSLDAFYMGHAADLAKDALDLHDQRPFGCVIVDPTVNTLIDYDRIIGWGWGSETPLDPTAHSEMDAIREACKFRGGFLHGCWLYSTHEPCTMCTGAILHAKISKVVWGSSRTDLPMLFRRLDSGDSRWHDTSHPPATVAGVLRDECVDLFNDELLAAI